MGLVLRLRKLGSNTCRTHQLDDSAVVLPSMPEGDRRGQVIAELYDRINTARVNKSFADLPLRGATRKQLRVYPKEHKMITLEWLD